jgi:hypothetical protein
MKQNILKLAFLLVATLGFAQVSELRKITAFNKIEVANGITLNFTQTDKGALQVTAADKEALPKVITIIKDKVLKIYLRPVSGIGETPNMVGVVVDVSQKLVNSFKAESGSAINFVNQLYVSEVVLNLSSGATFFGDIKCTTLAIDASSGAKCKGILEINALTGKFNSGSSVTLSGKAQKATIQIDSASKCNARNFATEEAWVNADSASKVEITVNQYLEAIATTEASIKYYGAPPGVKAVKNTMGKIIKS